jgi:hypothetical protein
MKVLDAKGVELKVGSEDLQAAIEHVGGGQGGD